MLIPHFTKRFWLCDGCHFGVFFQDHLEHFGERTCVCAAVQSSSFIGWMLLNAADGGNGFWNLLKCKYEAHCYVESNGGVSNSPMVRKFTSLSLNKPTSSSTRVNYSKFKFTYMFVIIFLRTILIKHSLCLFLVINGIIKMKAFLSKYILRIAINTHKHP